MRLLIILACMPFALHAQPARLAPGDPVENGVFGHAVDIDRIGRSVVVGSPAANVRPDVEDFGGAAYLFRKEDDVWTQRAKLVPTEIGRNDAFGTSVALSGDGRTVVVGAPLTTGSGFAAGAAYVFECDASSCLERARLESPTPEPGDLFGISVATDDVGSTVVVGAAGHGAFEGNAWTYQRKGDGWELTAELLSTSPQPYAAFGHSVSMTGDGTLIWVGEPLNSNGTTSRGAVHAFERAGGTWDLRETLRPEGLVSNGMFGFSVDLAADSLFGAVGAPGVGRNGTDSGTVTLFSRSGDAWRQSETLDVSLMPEAAWVARSVSVDASGSFVLVGAPGDTKNGYTAGRAFFYARWKGQWSLAAELEPDTARADDRFGYAVALSQDGAKAVIGARENNINEYDAGLVFAFESDLLPVANEPGPFEFWRVAKPLEDDQITTSVFPNPIERQGHIRWSVARPQRVLVIVSDVAGREAATIFDGWAPAGSSEVAWTPTRLSPGFYLIRVSGATGGIASPVILLP